MHLLCKTFKVDPGSSLHKQGQVQSDIFFRLGMWSNIIIEKMKYHAFDFSFCDH